MHEKLVGLTVSQIVTPEYHDDGNSWNAFCQHNVGYVVFEKRTIIL